EQFATRVGGGLHGVALSANETHVASVRGEVGVDVWDLPTNRTLATLPLDVDLHSVAISADGKLVAAGAGVTRDNDLGYSVHVWDTRTSKLVGRFDGHLAHVFCLRFSPDGRQLVSGSMDMSVRIWDIAKGRELRCIEI